jgi:hypothetical protein
MPPATPTQPPARLLWVEGKDDSAVVQSLCEKHRVPEVFAVQAKKGVKDVLDNFYTELRAPDAERFGLIVDANGDAQARWQSIRQTLEAEGYTELPERLAPDGMIVPGTPHRPGFGAWIMPDNGSPGALEEFAASLVPAGDALWMRAGEAVDAIPEEQRRFPAVRRSKAHVHTWLAWQERPGSPMGQAIGKGDLDAQASAAQRFVAWLRRLMVDDLPHTYAAPTT